MSKRIRCGHPVSLGDRHAVLSCPPRPLGRDSQKARRRRAGKKRAKRDRDLIPQRGVAVKGTGVPKGAAK